MADIANTKLDFLDALRYYEYVLDATSREFLLRYQGNWNGTGKDEFMENIKNNYGKGHYKISDAYSGPIYSINYNGETLHEIKGENMETYEVYSGLVIRKEDFEVLVENHVFAKSRQDAQNQLLVDLIRELDDDTDIDPSEYEFILNKVGNVSREKSSE